MGKRKFLTKAEIKKINKIDPSGRLLSGIYACPFIIFGIFFKILNHEFYDIIAYGLLTVGFILIMFIIIKTILIVRKERRLKFALMNSNIEEIHSLSPLEFEKYVARLFSLRGYKTNLTPVSSDYGLDVILEKEKVKIGVQVKHYTNAVGVRAVQEVIAGMKYYKCSEGYVVTSAHSFTAQAHNLANASNIKLIAYNDLAFLLTETKKMNEKLN